MLTTTKSALVPADGTQGPPEGPVGTPVTGAPVAAAVEVGGRVGPEPTRFGDWEKSGRCIDF